MSLERFIAAAASYCGLIETFRDYEPDGFVKRVHPRLAELYATAFFLPDVEPTDLEPEGRIEHREAFKLLDDLSSFLGEADAYRLVFNPSDLETTEILYGSLADDFVDTYRDVKEGLELWPHADRMTRQEILWQWRFNFIHHWSRHAASALYALADCLIEKELKRLDDETN